MTYTPKYETENGYYTIECKEYPYIDCREDEAFNYDAVSELIDILRLDLDMTIVRYHNPDAGTIVDVTDFFKEEEEEDYTESDFYKDNSTMYHGIGNIRSVI